MPRPYCAALLALFWLPLAAGAECTQLRYATNPNYPPFSWPGEHNDYKGASIELLKLVAPPGVALAPVVVPWKRSQAMAEAGEIDLLLSLRITPERERYLSFTRAAAFANPIVVFVKETSPIRYADWQTLKDYQGGVSLGDAFGNGFDEYMRDNLRFETALTMTENFRKLKAGRIDYFVSGDYLGRAYLRSAAGKAGPRVISLDPPISSGGIHFGFSRKSACVSLLKEMDARLAELNSKGTPTRLLDEALGAFALVSSYDWK
ncbi:transporter substrate-binding domain-containing protein [Niveibacterium sp. 24ML]|uniref:substrate-binding periplasmic protein n=1 Tax=Niveibacterium sp. 24ML TaxID=2985512 RepID=UPI00226F601F|nr:transporter substrate-binding domain-containing protein [Niveibacterium sp. 24ML]MCX9157412.1 transporter substrate-binding domain-containing protein [Niveibacterium sp. 24ML]